MFAIAYMMVSDSLVQNIIRERQKMVKQQMIISGVSLPAYWISHYLLDIVFQAPPSICAIIGIKAFNLDVRNTTGIQQIYLVPGCLGDHSDLHFCKSSLHLCVLLPLQVRLIGIHHYQTLLHLHRSYSTHRNPVPAYL